MASASWSAVRQCTLLRYERDQAQAELDFLWGTQSKAQSSGAGPFQVASRGMDPFQVNLIRVRCEQDAYKRQLGKHQLEHTEMTRQLALMTLALEQADVDLTQATKEYALELASKRP
ncbi:hypothetical protein AMTR_s00027p00198110 [Amborella trichopoda]|uniref:Uncharacterized protein n=1 Tax=Amborella trichopoda TaxID=13333 RepID=W1PST9_AMBTC|nr:hypothetical protein AMTR_s00027p00198110 [Amborella trichopoda]